MATDRLIRALVHGDLGLDDADEVVPLDQFSAEFRFKGEEPGSFVYLVLDYRTAWRSDGMDDTASEFDIFEADVSAPEPEEAE